MSRFGRCREFIVPAWPGVLAKLLVCETDNSVGQAVEAPVVYHQERSPRRFPMLPYQNQFTGTLLSPQTSLRGVAGGDSVAYEAARQARLRLGS